MVAEPRIETSGSPAEPVTGVAGMPENAYRPLKPGERYVPLVGDDQSVLEVSGRSIAFGLANTIFWSAAVSYLTLKIGQGIEAAIPIAILAIGFSATLKRKSTMLENVNVLALGATSGIVVGGSLFVLPAIHILGLESLSSFFQVFFVPLLGAALGVVLLIPLRRYFVRDMHGKLPFPEGTATAEVLVAGERGGNQAKVLLGAMGVGVVFDAMPVLFGAWRENFNTAAFSFLEGFTSRFKAVFALNTTAAIAGLGYLTGLRYAAYMMAGSIFSYWFVIPLFALLGRFTSMPVGFNVPPLAEMDQETLFGQYARYIGIGAISVAGLASVLKMLPVMGQALREGMKGVLARRGAGGAVEPRTDRDIPMPTVIALFFAIVAAIWVYYRTVVVASQPTPTALATFAVIIAVSIALLFSAVSAWAVAMISITPISGMTLMTLILSAVLLSHLGLSGREGMLAVLLVGGVVCTALSMTATLVTEFKISYWIGATPRKVQWSNIAGAAVASIVVTAVMLLLARVYGFQRSPAHPSPLPAPQANAMAAVLSFIMQNGDPTKWWLLGLGGVMSLAIELLGVSSLAFALGMYIPMEYNSPLLAGALVAHFVGKSSKDAGIVRARNERGILVASGLIAGGALAGVLSALAQFLESDVVGHRFIPRIGFTEGDGANLMGLVMFLGICAYMYVDARRARPDPVPGGA
jgi:putative OPT family oligopeptide transporter